MSKPTLLWISDNPHFCFVAQSIVTRRVLAGLLDEYDVEVLGYYSPIMARQSILDALPYNVHVVKRFDAENTLAKIKDLNPDILIVSHDAFQFQYLPKVRQMLPDTKIIGWFTIDGEPLPLLWQGILEACDLVVTPTEYGKRVLKESVFYLPVDVIPYGIDHSLYYPRRDQRKELVNELKQLPPPLNVLLPPEKFYYIFWGHNQLKKNITAIVDAWKLMDLRDKAHVLLVLHSNPTQRGDWLFPGDWHWRADAVPPGISILDGTYLDPTMSRLVQYCDSLVFPSIGEGFGMPILEAMAAGLIPITTDYAGPTSFCTEENSLLVEGTLLVGDFNIRRKVISVEALAEAMQKVFDIREHSPERFDEMRANAIETASKYTWERTVYEMKQAIERVTSSRYDRRWRTLQLG